MEALCTTHTLLVGMVATSPNPCCLLQGMPMRGGGPHFPYGPFQGPGGFPHGPVGPPVPLDGTRVPPPGPGGMGMGPLGPAPGPSGE